LPLATAAEILAGGGDSIGGQFTMTHVNLAVSVICT
jgi:hypothetical protein